MSVLAAAEKQKVIFLTNRCRFILTHIQDCIFFDSPMFYINTTAGLYTLMVKGSTLQFPQHHRADFHGTTLLITTQTPALRHNRIETGFDWLSLGGR